MICLEEAVNYYYLLHNMFSLDKENIYMTSVCDLALETREYNKLFGKLQLNGVRSKGIIDQFKSIDIPVEMFAQKVGEKLVIKGMYEDAIELYDLAGVSINFNIALRFSFIIDVDE